MELLQVVIPFVVALGASALATPLISRIAIKLGVIDRQHYNSVTKKKIPSDS